MPPVKDLIIGTEKFMLKARDIIIRTLLDHDQNNNYVTWDEFNRMVNNRIPEGFERRLDLVDGTEGIYDIHV